MIAQLLQFADLLVNYNVHYFLFFAMFLWIVWGIKLIRSRKYAPFTEEFNIPVSVVVPVYNESKENLVKCIDSVINNHPHEVIIVVDERDYSNFNFIKSKYGDKVKLLLSPKGKRPAIATGVRASSGEVICVFSSDSYFEDNNGLKELIKPFKDESIGGVCGRVRGVVTQKSISARLYRYIIELRNRLSYRALSVEKCVHVLNGECYAVRRNLFLSLLPRFLSQKFMGVTPDSGDDGWITTLLLENGYKTFYQETANVRTFAPCSMEQFILQQLRWSRNSVRRTLYTIKRRFLKQPAIFVMHETVNLVKAPLFAILIGLSVINLFLRLSPTLVMAHEYLDPYWSLFRILIFLVGLFIIRIIRGSPYLLAKEDCPVWFLPLYALISLFILVPLKIYALLTPKETGWMTRTDQKPSHNVYSMIALFIAVTPIAGLTFLLTITTVSGLVYDTY